jgi:hypothetical protein
MTIDKLYNNSQKINLQQLRDEVLMSIDHVIIDTITEQQLQLGVDAKGNSLPTYAPGNYSEYKNQKNPNSGGRYDLKDTGDFYSGLFQELTGDAIVIDSTDSKNDIIKDMMEGYDYLGLTSENFDKIQIEDAIPAFMTEFKNLMQID